MKVWVFVSVTAFVFPGAYFMTHPVTRGRGQGRRSPLMWYAAVLLVTVVAAWAGSTAASMSTTPIAGPPTTSSSSDPPSTSNVVKEASSHTTAAPAPRIAHGDTNASPLPGAETAIDRSKTEAPNPPIKNARTDEERHPRSNAKDALSWDRIAVAAHPLFQAPWNPPRPCLEPAVILRREQQAWDRRSDSAPPSRDVVAVVAAAAVGLPSSTQQSTFNESARMALWAVSQPRHTAGLARYDGCKLPGLGNVLYTQHARWHCTYHAMRTTMLRDPTCHKTSKAAKFRFSSLLQVRYDKIAALAFLLSPEGKRCAVAPSGPRPSTSSIQSQDVRVWAAVRARKVAAGVKSRIGDVFASVDCSDLRAFVRSDTAPFSPEMAAALPWTSLSSKSGVASLLGEVPAVRGEKVDGGGVARPNNIGGQSGVDAVSWAKATPVSAVLGSHALDLSPGGRSDLEAFKASGLRAAALCWGDTAQVASEPPQCGWGEIPKFYGTEAWWGARRFLDFHPRYYWAARTLYRRSMGAAAPPPAFITTARERPALLLHPAITDQAPHGSTPAAVGTPSPLVISVHLRRGDFEHHCTVIEKKRKPAWLTFERLESTCASPAPIGNGDRIEQRYKCGGRWAKRSCYPTLTEISNGFDKTSHDLVARIVAAEMEATRTGVRNTTAKHRPLTSVVSAAGVVTVTFLIGTNVPSEFSSLKDTRPALRPAPAQAEWVTKHQQAVAKDASARSAGAGGLSKEETAFLLAPDGPTGAAGSGLLVRWAVRLAQVRDRIVEELWAEALMSREFGPPSTLQHQGTKQEDFTAQTGGESMPFKAPAKAEKEAVGEPVCFQTGTCMEGLWGRFDKAAAGGPEGSPPFVPLRPVLDALIVEAGLLSMADGFIVNRYSSFSSLFVEMAVVHGRSDAALSNVWMW